jgi:hypothetical protein
MALLAVTISTLAGCAGTGQLSGDPCGGFSCALAGIDSED